MARTDTLGNFLTDIATAIRQKKGTTETIQASSFDTEIANIPTGNEPEKGIIITDWDSNGNPTVVKIKGLTSIPNAAFYNYSVNDGLFTELTSVNIPTGIAKLGNNVFYNCSKLILNEIPDTVSQIGNSCFFNCHSLVSMTIKGDITYMKNAAFRSCMNLEKIVFEGSATGIQNTVFYGDAKLTSVVFKSNTTIPTLNSNNSFSGTPIASGNGYIYIADNLVDSLKTANAWSTYANQIKPLSEYTEG